MSVQPNGIRHFAHCTKQPTVSVNFFGGVIYISSYLDTSWACQPLASVISHTSQKNRTSCVLVLICSIMYISSWHPMSVSPHGINHFAHCTQKNDGICRFCFSSVLYTSNLHPIVLTTVTFFLILQCVSPCYITPALFQTTKPPQGGGFQDSMLLLLPPVFIATHCNTLQHPAAPCSTL